MTIVSFFQELKSALEWAVNSELVFAILGVSVFLFVMYFVSGWIWRFVRDKFIFERSKRGN